MSNSIPPPSQQKKWEIIVPVKPHHISCIEWRCVYDVMSTGGF